MPYLRYDGPVPEVEVQGYGKFHPGEAKLVDVLTAGAFRDERCAAEGWEVSEEPFDVQVSESNSESEDE